MSPIANSPGLWAGSIPRPNATGHKYDRGHALIIAAPDLTGATRLASGACSRIGAGLVTVAAEQRDDVYRVCLPPDIMVTSDLNSDRPTVNTILIGPGGIGPNAQAALDSTNDSAVVVMDADALANHQLFGARFSHRVLTPHEGEFKVAFPNLNGSRQERAVAAALQSHSVIVLKGPETVIADAAGNVVLNTHASPYLAKAGSGDVLAGIITGLAAQGMSTFDASCAGVWIHGDAGRRCGPGLIPGDLIDAVPDVLLDLLA